MFPMIAASLGAGALDYLGQKKAAKQQKKYIGAANQAFDLAGAKNEQLYAQGQGYLDQGQNVLEQGFGDALNTAQGIGAGARQRVADQGVRAQGHISQALVDTGFNSPTLAAGM